MSDPVLCPITPDGIERMREFGIQYPDSYHGWYGLYRRRKSVGLERAFLKLGGRILVDVPVYLDAVRQRTAV